jgi:transposase
MRQIVNGIFYVMQVGCPWRLMPNGLQPWGTIYQWFAVWRVTHPHRGLSAVGQTRALAADGPMSGVTL